MSSDIVRIQGSGEVDIAQAADGKPIGSVITREEAMHAAIVAKQTYTVLVSKTPATGGDSKFLHLKNLSSSPLIITGLDLLAVGTAEKVEIADVTAGTASGGTANVPLNDHIGSNNLLGTTVTCEDGTDITGLTTGSVRRVCSVAADTPTPFRWAQPLVLGENGWIIFNAETTNIALVMHLFLYRDQGYFTKG